MTVRRLVAGVLVAASLGAFGGLGAATAATAPALRVVRLSPFTVQGTHFKAGERVTVTLVAARRTTAQATASARGVFVATFRGVRVGGCSYSVRATGSRGTFALLRAAATPACRPKAQLEFGATVVVKGANFRARERVRITLLTEEQTWTASATANARGAFQVDLGELPFNECHAYKLTVVGALGSRFLLNHPALPC